MDELTGCGRVILWIKASILTAVLCALGGIALAYLSGWGSIALAVLLFALALLPLGYASILTRS